MTWLLLLLVAAPPGTIRVRVEGDATEVVALQDGVVRHRAPVGGGEAHFFGLDPDVYDLQARGPAAASDLERGVRTVHDGKAGADALLVARPTFPVRVATEPGATLWVGGVAYEPKGLRLPAGLHRLVVDHPGFVSSAERLVRVAGPTGLTVTLEPGLSVTGRVVDDAGKPVAGAEVEAFADGFATGRRTQAGADGGFALRGFRGDVVSLRARAPGKAAALQRLVFFPGDERTRVSITLGPASTVTLTTTGHTVRYQGAEITGPLPDAEGVLLPEWYEEALEEPRLGANHTPQRAREDLAFPVTPGRRYRILVTAPGFRPASTEPFLAPPAGRTKKLPVLTGDPAGALHGHIEIIPGGAAKAGRIVVCQGPEGIARCRTDRAGRFVFGNLDPGEHIFWVAGVDETGTKVALAAGERLERVGLACRVDPERVITGRVLDADDQALAGVEVEAAGQRATTGKDGAFRLSALPRGPQRFTLHFRPGPGCRALAADPHLPHVERKVGVGAETQIRLVRAGRLWVRLDPGDRQLARTRLLVASVATGARLERKLAYRAKEAVVHDLPVGSHRVEVAAPGVLGTAGAVVPVTPAPAAPTVLIIAPGRTARGKVFLRREDAQGVIHDLALDRGWVTLLDGEPLRALATVPVEADGTFVLQGLPAAPVLLCAAAPGLPVAQARVDLTPGDAEAIRIGLQQGAEAAVIVTGEGGETLPNARVRVLSEHGVDTRDLAARGRFLGVVADDDDLLGLRRFFRLRRGPGGRIAAPFVQPGSYRFVISADGYEPARAGVRARSAAAVKRLREGFERIKGDFPSGPPDLATPVRLLRATGGD